MYKNSFIFCEGTGLLKQIWGKIRRNTDELFYDIDGEKFLGITSKAENIKGKIKDIKERYKSQIYLTT